MRVTLTDSIGQLVFRELAARDSLGLWLTNLEGWAGHPGPRDSKTDRPQNDGTYPNALLLSPGRTITMSVAGKCASSVEASNLIDRLAGLFGQSLTLVVEDANGLRWANVRVDDDIAPVLLPSRRTVTCELVLYADDPLKYGRAATYAAEDGKLTVWNSGTAPVLPSVTVTGSPTAFKLSFDGHEVSWKGDGKSPTVTFDFALGVPTSGTLGNDDVFTLPPGSRNIVTVTSSPSAAQLSMTVTPAWR